MGDTVKKSTIPMHDLIDLTLGLQENSQCLLIILIFPRVP